ncbi:septation protein SepH [Arthrobacter sp. KK5.5]|uniref:septation protein SepH n=1 Tax=Arthrobacter sp. KK5.5 TaxID=3373084 RepID=UPI003EE4DFB0
MRELRLVGVHEDGEHLLLGSDDGSSFTLRLDEALRAATTRPIGRPAAAQADQAATLSPREIQARIRSGSTAEEVAEQFGVPLANVLRYEGPVRAERDHIARQARAVEVSGPQANDGYRSAFGEEPASLGEMVDVRLNNFGVDPAAVEWDAWRRSDGSWDVEARFEVAAANQRSNIGEEPPAKWVYHPVRKSLVNSNRWAQVLSELEPMDTPVAGRRLTAVADRPFDFETDADAAQNAAEADAGAASDRDRERDDFLDILRSRRGQRLGTDEEGDDALAEMLTKGSIPAAHPRDEEFFDASEARRLGMVPEANVDDDDIPHLHDGVSTQTSEFSVVPGLRAMRFDHDQDDAEGSDEATKATDDESQPRKAKQKRSSVPSWDEIVFGRKND